MNCEDCKHWIYGYCRLLGCSHEKDSLCNAWELSKSYEKIARMNAEYEMSLTDKLLESRQSPETLLARIAELEKVGEELAQAASDYMVSAPDEYSDFSAVLLHNALDKWVAVTRGIDKENIK